MLIPLISFNLLHSENIYDISVTLEVLKFDRSKYNNSSHLWNNPDIFLTFLVLKVLIPLISFNLLHSKNINLISIRLEVTKFDKSKYSNDLHPKNIPPMFVTFAVLKLLIPFISFNL